MSSRLESLARERLAQSVGDRLDHDLAVERLLHSEGWLRPDQLPHDQATIPRRSPAPEASEYVLLT